MFPACVSPNEINFFSREFRIQRELYNALVRDLVIYSQSRRDELFVVLGSASIFKFVSLTRDVLVIREIRVELSSGLPPVEQNLL